MRPWLRPMPPVSKRCRLLLSDLFEHLLSDLLENLLSDSCANFLGNVFADEKQHWSVKAGENAVQTLILYWTVHADVGVAESTRFAKPLWSAWFL